MDEKDSVDDFFTYEGKSNREASRMFYDQIKKVLRGAHYSASETENEEIALDALTKVWGLAKKKKLPKKGLNQFIGDVVRKTAITNVRKTPAEKRLTNTFDILVNKRLKALEITIPGLETFKIKSDYKLTPQYLMDVISPYLEAISDVQNVLNDVKGFREPKYVVVKYLSQLSPIDVSLEGASEAIQSIKEDIIPWRKENAKKLADLKGKEAQAEIRKKEAEAAEIRAGAIKSRAEARKLEAEAMKTRAEAQKLNIENEKLRFDFERSRLQLALDIVSKVKPQISDPERYAYAVRLLPALNTLTTSDLQISPKLFSNDLFE